MVRTILCAETAFSLSLCAPPSLFRPSGSQFHRTSLKEMEGGGGGGRYWSTQDTDPEITRALQIALSHGSSSYSTFPPTPPTHTTFTVSASDDSNTNSSSIFAKPTAYAAGLKVRKMCKRKSWASKRASSSTRYIVTDLSNFREKVQQFTGVEGDAMGFTEHEPPEKLERKRGTVPESCLPTLDTSANLFNCGTKEDRSTFPPLPPPATSSYFLTSDQFWRDLLETGISGSMPSPFLPSPTWGGGGELSLVPPVLETAIAGSLSSFPPPSPPLFPFPTLDSWSGVI